MTTPHISASPGDFAPAVLMPGDPKRAERIAFEVLDNPKKVNEVRGMLAYTGTHRGRPLSVMGSGMGQPSIAIYATELYRFFGVERIIRVGTCGGISSKVEVGDTVVALGAHTNSNFNAHRIPQVYFSALASYNLVRAAVEAAPQDTQVHVGPVYSSDDFYRRVPGQVEALAQYGVLGVEMETAALYGIAAELDKQALTVLTVSDHLLDGASDMDSTERETRFQGALHLAIGAAFSGIGKARDLM